jgi:hypothetical protein
MTSVLNFRASMMEFSRTGAVNYNGLPALISLWLGRIRSSQVM